MHAGICSLLGLNHPVEQEGSPESIPLDSPAKALGSRTPTGANVGMSAGRAPGMPMTFWAVVSLQRPLPGDGLQVRQQVPLPLSLRELQVRLQNLRQGRVPLPGPHQPQQQPGERARPVRLLLPAVSLSQPGQPPGEQGQGCGGGAGAGRGETEFLMPAGSQPSPDSGRDTVCPWRAGAGVRVDAQWVNSVISSEPSLVTPGWAAAVPLALFHLLERARLPFPKGLDFKIGTLDT